MIKNRVTENTSEIRLVHVAFHSEVFERDSFVVEGDFAGDVITIDGFEAGGVDLVRSQTFVSSWTNNYWFEIHLGVLLLRVSDMLWGLASSLAIPSRLRYRLSVLVLPQWTRVQHQQDRLSQKTAGDGQLLSSDH